MAHVTTSSPDGRFAARGWARGSAGLLGALDRWALPALLVLMAAYVVVFTAMAIARLDAFRQGFDLVSYLQPIWNTSQGRPFEQSIYAGARTILLKLGPEGVVVATPQTRERVSGFKVNSIDATGAGDCFAGSLLARLCAGDDVIAAARYANAAAALSTTGYGAVAPIPRPAQVFALLEK